jgi:hypothetical protein
MKMYEQLLTGITSSFNEQEAPKPPVRGRWRSLRM